MTQVRIALAQLNCEDGEVANNLARLEQVVHRYGRFHDLILFPETFLGGFPSSDVCRALAEPLNGPNVKRLEELAKEADTSIAVGLYEKDGENVYNTTVLVGPAGLVLSYRKTHLWVGESVKPGYRFRSRNWQGTRIGLLICYDIEFPETARAIAGMGAELLLVTDGNWDGPVHRVAVQARAQENQIFVALTNRVGQWKDTTFCGGSIVVDPYGRVIAEAGEGEEVLSATIDMKLVQDSRRQYHYLKERRVFLNTRSKECGEGIRESQI